MRKDARQLVRRLERQGWRVDPSGDVVRCYAPNGSDLITFHHTESDPRAAKNTLARLRRAGFAG